VVLHALGDAQWTEILCEGFGDATTSRRE